MKSPKIRVITESKSFYNASHSYKSDDKRAVIEKDIKVTEEKKSAALKKTEDLVTKEMKAEAKSTKLTALPRMSEIEFAI